MPLKDKAALDALVTKQLESSVIKVRENMRRFTQSTPHITDDLLYSHSLSTDGSWTAGFWFGLVTLAAIYSRDHAPYTKYLASFKDFFRRRVENGYKDHDLGFLYQLYAIDGYRLTNDMEYLELADKAARCLYARYNPRGGYIRAWGPLATLERDGTIISDCMMNLPFLFCTANSGGDPRYREAAICHAQATLHNIRSDGSVYHTFRFDPVTGAPIAGGNEGGYADESCWSRGIAWMIYGYYLAWAHTGIDAFLNASIRTADYFISQTESSHLPLWDFKCDDEQNNIVDTSAAAIVCCALYRMAESLNNQQYQAFADQMLTSLIQKHSHAADANAEILLDSGLCRRDVNHARISVHCGTIWGDYFYLEALMLRCGYKVRMWEM